MNIPDEAIKQAFFDFPSIVGATYGDYILRGSQVIGEWARKEALREAEALFRGQDNHFHTHEAAYAVHALAEGRDWFAEIESHPAAAYEAFYAYDEEVS